MRSACRSRNASAGYEKVGRRNGRQLKTPGRLFVALTALHPGALYRFAHGYLVVRYIQDGLFIAKPGSRPGMRTVVRIIGMRCSLYVLALLAALPIIK